MKANIARKLAASYRAVTGTKNDVISEIKREALEGKCFIKYYGEIDFETHKWLKKEGYNVGGTADSPYYTISY